MATTKKKPIGIHKNNKPLLRSGVKVIISDPVVEKALSARKTVVKHPPLKSSPYPTPTRYFYLRDTARNPLACIAYSRVSSTVVHYGLSVRNPKDTFVKKRARVTAATRMVDGPNFDFHYRPKKQPNPKELLQTILEHLTVQDWMEKPSARVLEAAKEALAYMSAVPTKRSAQHRAEVLRRLAKLWSQHQNLSLRYLLDIDALSNEGGPTEDFRHLEQCRDMVS